MPYLEGMAYLSRFMAWFAYLRKNGDSLIAAAAGFCIIILLARHGGIGISPDSVTYMSVAENLHSHHELKDFSQLALIDFPPFYPLFLQFVMTVTGMKPLLFAPGLNAFLFALVIYSCGVMMNRFSFYNRWYKIALLSCIVLSPSLQEIYSMLWSETLFIVLLLLLIITLYHYYRSRSILLLLLLGLLAGLACITRYAGIAFFVTAAFLLLVSPGLPIRKRLLHFLVFVAVSACLPAINLVHNRHASGTLTGYREEAIRSVWDNISDTGAVFCQWLPFLRKYPAAAPVVALLLIIALGLGWIWRLWRKRQFDSYENITTGFFLSYTLFMIISASLSRYQPLDNRLLCPVFIPLLWSIGGWLMAAIQMAGRWKKIWIAVGLLFFACFQYSQVRDDLETWTDIRYAGIPGYTEDQWQHSPTVLYIQKNKAAFRYGFGMYSNANDAIWFFTGMKAELLPHTDFGNDVKEFLTEKHCYVVWFNDGYNPDLAGLDFIINEKKMQLVEQLPDGAVYITP